MKNWMINLLQDNTTFLKTNKMGYKTKVISAFPCTGKSCYYRYSTDSIDSDSSKFSWIYKEDGEKERNPNFVEEYVRHIKVLKESGIARIIFVSSHEEVRKELIKQGILDILIYPNINTKHDHVLRICDRGGTDDPLASIVEDNWDEWITSCMNEENVIKIELQKGKYIGDVI